VSLSDWDIGDSVHFSLPAKEIGARKKSERFHLTNAPARIILETNKTLFVSVVLDNKQVDTLH
jgi:hypothetical protein